MSTVDESEEILKQSEALVVNYIQAEVIAMVSLRFVSQYNSSLHVVTNLLQSPKTRPYFLVKIQMRSNFAFYVSDGEKFYPTSMSVISRLCDGDDKTQAILYQGYYHTFKILQTRIALALGQDVSITEDQLSAMKRAIAEYAKNV